MKLKPNTTYESRHVKWSYTQIIVGPRGGLKIRYIYDIDAPKPERIKRLPYGFGKPIEVKE